MQPSSSNPVDLVLPAAVKDYSKLPRVIESVRRYTEVETIHIIAPEPEGIRNTWPKVVVHADADVLPYDREELPFRPSWVFQQILKVFQDVTENDWFLVMDADIIINRPIPLWTVEGKPIFNLGRDQYNFAYFVFNEKLLGFGKLYPWSFLSECVLYNKQLVREMLRYCGLTLDDFWRKLVEIVSVSCHPADAELYGSYIVQEQPDVYEIRHLQTTLGGRYGKHTWSDREMESEIRNIQQRKPNAHLISIHTWA